jgi:hypothetical protein
VECQTSEHKSFCFEETKSVMQLVSNNLHQKVTTKYRKIGDNVVCATVTSNVSRKDLQNYVDQSFSQVPTINAKIKAFANQMGINYEEIAELQEPTWLNNSEMTENIISNSKVAIKGKWENAVLLNLLNSLASLSISLRLSSDFGVVKPIMSAIEDDEITLEQMTSPWTMQKSQLFFKSEPTFNFQQHSITVTDRLSY